MTNHTRKIQITVDHREAPSGIPARLIEKDVPVIIVTLKTGDYIINNTIAVERKSGEDFIQSLISERLFTQCARLSRSGYRPFLLLEGSPFQTAHHIDRRAIKGALLSVIASWQIPVIYSKNTEDTTEQLILLAEQHQKHDHLVKLSGYKSKRIKNQRLRFLQGIPNTGPVMAARMYEHFGSLEAIINASEKELRQVEGIGKKTAAKIREFLTR